MVALLLGPPTRVSRGVYRYCVGISVLLLLILFGQREGPLPNVGGWLRSALYKLPMVSEIPVHRFVAPLLFFATVFAAFGIEHVVNADRANLRLTRRPILRAVLVLGFAAFWIGLADSRRDSPDRAGDPTRPLSASSRRSPSAGTSSRARSFPRSSCW